MFYEKSMKPIIFSKPFNLFEIEIKEAAGMMNFGDFTVMVHKTIHTGGSIAYKFAEGEKSLVISGDTDFDETFAEFSEDADVLLLECSFSNERKAEGHLIPKECAEIAKRANVRKLVLTHLYPLDDEKIILKQAKSAFENTILTQDLMEIRL